MTANCAHCSKTSIVLDALFNRIHTLEKQLEQCSADKDAANRTMLRVLDAQANKKINGHKTSNNSSTIVEFSSEASLSPKRSTNFSVKSETNNDDVPLIDLLGPLECPNEPVVRSATTEDVAVVAGASSSPSDSCDGIEFQGSSHTRRFHKKQKEYEQVTQAAGSFAPDVASVYVSGSSSPEQIKSVSNMGRLAFIQKELIYPISDDADSENSQNGKGASTFNASFGIGQELPSGQSDLADRTSSSKAYSAPFTPSGIGPAKQCHGLSHSQWAPVNGPAPSGLSISPEARWEKYCQTVDVRHLNGKLLERPSLNRLIPKTTVVRLFTANQSRNRDVADIFFKPKGIENEFYRTCIIYDLPLDASMTDILNEVRGGMILDAKMVDTTSVTGSQSVILTFAENSAAGKMPKLYKGHGKVYLIPTPTRPLSFGIRRGINNHHSRCLSIRKFPRIIGPKQLEAECGMYKTTRLNSIESMIMTAEGVLEIRFLSIAAAEFASDHLRLSPKYDRCRVSYAKDPCSEPWFEEQNKDGATQKACPGMKNGLDTYTFAMDEDLGKQVTIEQNQAKVGEKPVAILWSGNNG